MAKSEFDEIRDKLYDHEEPVDSGLWPDIQESLRRRRIRMIFCRALSSAAVIAAIFVAITSVDGRRARELEYFAQLFSSMPVKQATVVESAPQGEVRREPQIQSEKLSDTVVLQNSFMAGQQVVVQQRGAVVQRGEVEGKTGDAVADGEHEAVVEKTAPKKESADTSPEQVQVPQRNMSARQLYYDDWAGLPQTDEGSRKRYAVAFTGGFMPGSSASVTGSRVMAVSSADDAHHGYLVEQVSDTKYSLPVNLGVQLQFPVGENLALGVGVSYTRLRSKFDCLVNKVRYSGSQTLHYVGIPVNVYGIIAQRNKFAFYVNGGAMLEKGIRAKYKFNSYKDSHSNSTKIDGLQFSVNAGLGVEYRFSDYVGLYFEPNIIYFTNSDIQYSVRTDQPLQIKAELGCRFHF